MLVFLIVAIGVALFVLVFGAVATESARIRFLTICTIAALLVGGGVALYFSAVGQPG